MNDEPTPLFTKPLFGKRHAVLLVVFVVGYGLFASLQPNPTRVPRPKNDRQLIEKNAHREVLELFVLLLEATDDYYPEKDAFVEDLQKLYNGKKNSTERIRWLLDEGVKLRTGLDRFRLPEPEWTATWEFLLVRVAHELGFDRERKTRHER